jgi:hypothetical protein
VNVTVFTMTRRILPPDSFKLLEWAISNPQPSPEYTIEAGPDSLYQSKGTYPESYGAKEKSYSSDTDSMRTTDSAVPTMLAPPPRSHCGSGERVYSLYEADSAIPLTPPADVAYYVGYGR